ncbi:MAG: GAF domain-containing sensor histidine kinase [Chloroflexi bacterium]|nr:GAF domain-containing sensor histidine kinase [Chloroflexota bacterium]
MMKGFDKPLTKEQLLNELVQMCQRIVDLEASESTRQSNRALNLLNRVGQELTATIDSNQVTEQLLPAATEIIGAEGASVWLREGVSESDWLVCRMAYHHGETRTPVDLRIRPGEGIAGWVAQRRESAVVPNVRDDHRFFSGIDEQTGFQTTSLLAVPLWTHDRVIGVLEVVNKQAGEFTWNDRVLAETLAASAAIAIENARLTGTLRQRTLDLQASHKQLDAFTNVMVEDLRTSLGLIVSFAQMLEKDHTTLSTEELNHYLHTIAIRGGEMVSVVDKLLATQTGPPQKVEEEIAPLDTTGIVALVLERLAYIIERYKTEITQPENWPMALGYAPWVEEVWANYIHNAIKYGGRPPRVELGFDANGSTIRFWVRDNGRGLLPEEQVRLFAPSTRRERLHDTQYGLGLALVQRIVEKLGGQVGVESDKGQGNLFYFTLPVAE